MKECPRIGYGQQHQSEPGLAIEKNISSVKLMCVLYSKFENNDNPALNRNRLSGIFPVTALGQGVQSVPARLLKTRSTQGWTAEHGPPGLILFDNPGKGRL